MDIVDQIMTDATDITDIANMTDRATVMMGVTNKHNWTAPHCMHFFIVVPSFLLVNDVYALWDAYPSTTGIIFSVFFLLENCQVPNPPW